MHEPTTTHPYSPDLRERADHLSRLATTIERSRVMTLPDAGGEDVWHTRRAHLCEAMLRCNLHQLHRAADDLRLTAFRLRQRADELDEAHRTAA